MQTWSSDLKVRTWLFVFKVWKYELKVGFFSLLPYEESSIISYIFSFHHTTFSYFVIPSYLRYTLLALTREQHLNSMCVHPFTFFIHHIEYTHSHHTLSHISRVYFVSHLILNFILLTFVLCFFLFPFPFFSHLLFQFQSSIAKMQYFSTLTYLFASTQVDPTVGICRI